MRRICGLLTILALPLGSAPALAAPEEIQVYVDDLTPPGRFGMDVHNNYVLSGRTVPEYPGEQPPDHVYRLTPEFYYGMDKGDDIAVELEPGKALVIKFLTVGEPHPDGTRTVFFELNGQPREVSVRDRTLQVTVQAKPKADPGQPGQIGAPIPGVVSTVAVQLNQQLKKGERLLVLEAMKMQSTVYAPVGGTVKQLLVQPGQQVEAKDLLLVIE